MLQNTEKKPHLPIVILITLFSWYVLFLGWFFWVLCGSIQEEHEEVEEEEIFVFGFLMSSSVSKNITHHEHYY